MNQILNNDTQTRLLKIRDEVITHITAFQVGLDSFMSKHANKLSVRNIEDIDIIKKSSAELRDKVNGELSMAAINASSKNEEEFIRFLAKLRHDLHNTINIIMGYTELLLTDFQKRNEAEHVKDFSSHIVELSHITKLTNDIRTNDFSTVNLERYTMTEVEKDLELDEFDIFKKKISILVVDDIPDNCRILERYLTELGFEKISAAYDGLQTLKLLKKNKYDLILLDIDMPNVSGKEVLSLVKEDLIEQKYSIIIISGSDNMKDTIECIRLGAEDLIIKPFLPDLLRVRINSCVERKWYKYKENVYRMKYDSVKKNLMRGYYALNMLYFLWKI